MEFSLIFSGEKIKDKNKRYVAYKCGNNYILNTEKVLFGENQKNYIEYETTFDEVWYIPQQHETNFGFFSSVSDETASSYLTHK